MQPPQAMTTAIRSGGASLRDRTCSLGLTVIARLLVLCCFCVVVIAIIGSGFAVEPAPTPMVPSAEGSVGVLELASAYSVTAATTPTLAKRLGDVPRKRPRHP